MAQVADHMSALEPLQVKALQQLLLRQPKVEGAGVVEQFVLRYIFFEAALREVLSAYRAARPIKGASGKKNEHIRKDVVVRSLTHFEIKLSLEVVEALLDSKLQTRGAKSARNLRNALVHEWKAEDAAEVESRAAPLLTHLSQGVEAIACRLVSALVVDTVT